MSNKYLDILEGTDYKVQVCRSEGFDVIALTRDVYHPDGYVVDYDLIAEETMFGGVSEEGIRNFASREIQKNEKATTLYGVYTGKKENE